MEPGGATHPLTEKRQTASASSGSAAGPKRPQLRSLALARRLVFILSAGTVWMWGVTLCSLWRTEFGSTGPDLWSSAAAGLLAFVVGLAAPVQFFRTLQVLLGLILPRYALALPALETDTADSAQQVSHLLGAALIVAALGSMASALTVPLGGRAARWLAEGFLLPLWSLRVWRFCMQTVCMLGWGLGAALVWQAHAAARGFAGRSPADRGRGHEDWLWSLALASLLLLALGGHQRRLLLAGLAAGLVQLLAGLGLLRYAIGSRWPRPVSPPSVKPPAIWIRLGVFLRAGAMAIVAVVQLRFLSDLWNVGARGPTAFLALTCLLLAWFHRRWAGRSDLRSPAALAGARVLAMACLAVQWSLGAAALLCTAPFGWLAVLAVAAQAPLAAAAVCLATAGRYRYADAGGSARNWAQWVLGGLAAGLLLCSLGGFADVRSSLPLVVLLAGLALAVLKGTAVFESLHRQAAWSMAGGLLMVSMAGLLAASTGACGSPRLAVARGRRLSAYSLGDHVGFLPLPTGTAPRALETAAVDLLRNLSHIASDSPPSDKPDDERAVAHTLLPGPQWLLARTPDARFGDIQAIQVTRAAADPAVCRLLVPARPPCRDLLDLLRTGADRYHGVIYAPIRVDHPAGDDLYGPLALHQLDQLIAPGGVLFLHLTWTADSDPTRQRVLAVIEHYAASGRCVVACARAHTGGEVLLVVLSDADRASRLPSMEAIRRAFAEAADVVLAGDDLLRHCQAVLFPTDG